MRSIDPNLEQAAADLGAGPWQRFAEVTFPLSLPGLASGLILVWTWAMGEYVAPVVLGGGHVRVMSQELAVSFLQRMDWPFGAAVCIVLLVPVGAVVWLLGRYVGKVGITSRRAR
jgi:spermidine/putrescine transport system permease protein